MILTKSKDIHITVDYSEEVQDGDNLEMSDRCAAVVITKDIIPSPLYMSFIEHWETKEISSHNIKLLQGVNLHISDTSTAYTLFEILNSDFEGINLKEKYPDLFL